MIVVFIIIIAPNAMSACVLLSDKKFERKVKTRGKKNNCQKLITIAKKKSEMS